MQITVIKRRAVLPWDVQDREKTENGLQQGMSTLLEVMEMFLILMMVMVLWKYMPKLIKLYFKHV